MCGTSTTPRDGLVRGSLTDTELTSTAAVGADCAPTYVFELIQTNGDAIAYPYIGTIQVTDVSSLLVTAGGLMPQIIGSSGQTVNAVGQSTMAVHASVVRAVGALTAAAGATPLIRAAERSVYADTITLAATDGVIVGNGTVDLPTIASQDEDPQAFLISAVGGAITVVPHEDDEAIFGLDNQLVSEVTVEANTVLTLLRYVGVWRVIDSSAGGSGGSAVASVDGRTGAVTLDDLYDPAGTAAGLVDDLSGVSNQATARTNLGLGTAATAATGDFAAASHTHTGTQVSVDASGFNGNLTTSDDTVQEVAQKLDDLVIPAAGIADPGGANDDFLQRKAGAWTHRTVAQVQTDLGVPLKYVVPRITGEWYSTRGPVATAFFGGTNATTGRIQCIPVYLHAGTIDRIGVYTTSAGSGTTWRLGIYPSGTDGLPDGQARLIDAGTVDMGATAGLLAITISQSIATAGLYWLVCLSDAYSATPTVYAWGAQSMPIQELEGLPTFFASNSERSGWMRTATGVTTGSIPSTCPTLAWGNSGPKIAVRAA
jgi:hypothetical protein